MKNIINVAAPLCSAILFFSCLPQKEFLEYSPPPNHAPILNPISDRVVYVGDFIGITPSGTDPDNDNLQYFISGWMTETTKVAQSTDLGAQIVTVTASDGVSTSSASFSVTIINYRWSGISPTVGVTQPDISGHVSIYDEINKVMIVFGGVVQNNIYLNWLSMFSLLTDGLEFWWDLNPLVPDGTPPKRANHSMICDIENKKMILFGGINPITLYFNDTWELSFTETTDGKWCPLPTTGSKPSPRASHTAIFDPIGQRMIVFGGTKYTTTGACPIEASCILGDLWALNLTDMTWQEIIPPNPRPSPRKGHVAAYDPERKQMVVFGGLACPSTMCSETDETWSLDLSMQGNEHWTRIFPEGTPPESRQGATAVYLPLSDKIILVGGRRGASVFGDVRFLNLKRPTWGRTYPDGPLFSARSDHTMVFDSYNSRLIVFGGLGPGDVGFNDTWSLK